MHNANLTAVSFHYCLALAVELHAKLKKQTTDTKRVPTVTKAHVGLGKGFLCKHVKCKHIKHKLLQLLSCLSTGIHGYYMMPPVCSALEKKLLVKLCEDTDETSLSENIIPGATGTRSEPWRSTDTEVSFYQ